MSEPKHAVPRATTFGDLLANREYRAVYSASALSWFGDFLARAAVTALVFHQTRSVALSAASFAVGYLPGLTAGPVLAALAERYPHRAAMVTCDVARAALIAIVAIRGIPIPAMFVLLFVTALLSPPFDASRSALLPKILEGDRYVVGVSLQNTTNALTLVLGYFVGGALAPSHPHLVLLADAITFMISAVIIRFGIQARPAGLSPTARTGLFAETAAGFRLVYRSPMLRSIALVVLGTWLFAIAPEGLAASWAVRLAGHHDPGVDQALIMMSVPAGSVLGAMVVGRLVAADRRQTLIRPLALLTPLALVPAFTNPSAGVITALGALAGFGSAGLTAPANGLFVQAVPIAFRARAFGVMQFGLQIVQGAALLLTGLLADRFPLPTVVGAWGVVGVVVMATLSVTWPSESVITAGIEAAQVADAASLDRAGAGVSGGGVSGAGVSGAGVSGAGLDDGAAETAHRPSPRPRMGLRQATGPIHRSDSGRSRAEVSDPLT